MGGQTKGRDYIEPGSGAVQQNADVEREKDWSHATAVGEVAWHRWCRSQGMDPKDPTLASARSEMVSLVRDAAFVLERDGFEGAAAWLEAERMVE